MTSESDDWTVPHGDAYTQDLDPNRDGSYSVDITVSASDTPENEAAVNDRGTDVPLEHPVEDPEELRHRAHLTAQLAARNKTETVPDEPVVAFDEAVLAVADRSLDAAGIDVTDSPIEKSFLYAFLLEDVWKFNSRLKLIQHLDDHPTITEHLGMGGPPKKSTVYRRAQTLEDEGLEDKVREASVHALHAVWRNGEHIPEPVLESWDIDSTAVLDEYPVSAETRRTAIRNWVDVLLGDAADTLTFDRAENASYSIEEYLGVFAHSALQNIGLTAVPNTAGWLYDADQFPTGDSLIKHIKKDTLDLSDIEAQFAAANAAVFERGESLGLFDQELDFAFDTVDITWWGYPTRATVGMRRPATDATPDWVYCVLLAVTTDARLCFGVTLVKSKDLYNRALDDQLRTATTYADVRHLYADKEFYDGTIIETLRKHIGDGWVVKAQRRDHVKEFISDLQKTEPGYRESLPVTSATPNPAAFAIPDDLPEQQTLTQFTDGNAHESSGEGANSTHTVYLTDMEPGDLTAELLDERYNDRWSVETWMRQYRHDTHPVCHSGNVKIRVYCANIAMLFLNWHALINRALSPEYNLPVTVTHQELLTAIRDVAFTDAGNDEP